LLPIILEAGVCRKNIRSGKKLHKHAQAIYFEESQRNAFSYSQNGCGYKQVEIRIISKDILSDNLEGYSFICFWIG